MHIAIDARMYGTAQRGIGRYLIKLIENLEAISSLRDGSPSLSDDAHHQFIIFLRRVNFEEYQPKNPNFKKALWDAPWYGIREQLLFKQLFSANSKFVNSLIKKQATNQLINQLTNSPINLHHFPHWNVPLFFNRPFVVTIHDLQLFSSSRVREATTRGKFVYALKFLAFKIIFRHTVLTAKAIIVPSNYVREQLIAKYPQTREKINVIYEAPTTSTAVNSKFVNLLIKNQTTNQLINQLTNHHYALYVGAAYPHKNLERLLKAWDIVHQELPDYKLVLVGQEDHFWKKLKNNAPPLTPPPRGGEMIQFPPLPEGRRGGVGVWEGNIIFYGSATDAELTTLYKHASLLVQPSLEEGFSLTPLEALSFGCPVAVSDIPVHREILQNVATYFNPQDEEDIARAIKNTLANTTAKNQTLGHTDELLARYSWKTNAQQTLQLYNTTKKV